MTTMEPLRISKKLTKHLVKKAEERDLDVESLLCAEFGMEQDDQVSLEDDGEAVRRLDLVLASMAAEPPRPKRVCRWVGPMVEFG